MHIYLAKPLQYERVSQYTLTLQVRNSPDLVEEALLHISVQDENNQAPVFTNVESGNVLEHEPPGTIVMQVIKTGLLTRSITCNLAHTELVGVLMLFRMSQFILDFLADASCVSSRCLPSTTTARSLTTK